MNVLNKIALITGITGQDGSYLAEFLLEKGYTVIGVYRRSSTNTHSNIEHLKEHPAFKLVCGDITDYSSMFNIINLYHPDEVYNLAAQSHVAVSFDQPLYTWQVTAGGVLNILDILHKLQTEEYQPRFYQASSSEMFGDQYNTIEWNDRSDEHYQDEDTPMNPRSPYGIAKLAAHHSVKVYKDSYGMFACSGILFNHESERRGENFVTRKITKYVAELAHHRNSKYSLDPDYLENFPKLHLGNLDATRDWGHAKDYVRAMWLMLQQEKPDDYVVATGKAYSIREFLDLAFGSIGIQDWEKFVEVDQKFYRPCEVPYLCGKSDKVFQKLGWEPNISFSDLVCDMVTSDYNKTFLGGDGKVHEKL